MRQRGISLSKCCLNCSGVLPTGSPPSLAIFSATSGAFTALPISTLSRCTTGAGVPAGASQPCHVVVTYPARPLRRRWVMRGGLPNASRWKPRGPAAGLFSRRKTRQYVAEHELYLSGGQIRKCLSRTLVEHVRDVDSRHGLQQFHRQMVRVPCPAEPKSSASGRSSQVQSAPSPISLGRWDAPLK